ncbi:hypothetical protein LCGC14_2390460, partial [marine sediment metagenome]
DTGMYRAASNNLQFVTGGGQRLGLTASSFVAPAVYTATSGSAANVYVANGGKLWRSTASSRAYKIDIRPLAKPPIVHASTFRYIPGYVDDDPEGLVMHYGFIAQDVQAALGDGSVTYNEDGSVDDYNWKHIIATLEARIAILEARE